MPNFLKAMKRVSVKLYNPETLAWEAAVILAGSTVSVATKDGVEAFVSACKNNGLWAKLVEVMPFAGGGNGGGAGPLAGALVKLKYATAQSMTNVNFVGGDYQETGANGGLAGNGTTKYLNCAYNPNTAALPLACHASIYLRDDAPGSGVQIALGANGSLVTYLQVGSVAANASCTCRLHDTPAATYAAAFTKGFYYAERQGATDLQLWKNDASVASVATNTALGMFNGNVYAYARNNNGSAADFLNARLSFITIGLAMTANEKSQLYTYIQRLQTVLGRNV